LFAVIGLALLVALGSGAIALFALSEAREAQQRVDQLTSGTPSGQDDPLVPDELVGASSTPTPVDTTEAAPPDTNEAGSPQDIDPSAEFSLEYQDEALQLLGPECGNEYGIDLDEPWVNVDVNYEVTFEPRCNSSPPALILTYEVRGALPTATSNVTPGDCIELIRTAPLGDPRIPLRPETVLCVLTSLEEAQEERITQKLVILEITAVGANGAVSVLATAWNVPE